MTKPESSGANLIALERVRQLAEEGWHADHDDEHCNFELLTAAACYIQNASRLKYHARRLPPADWPWDSEWWKPTDRVRDLVKAGALIAAEIDRLVREAVKDNA